MAKAKVLTPSQVKLLIETYTNNKDINATAKTVGLSKSVCITRLKNEGIITIDEANALRGTVKKSNKNSQTDKNKTTSTTKTAKTSTKTKPVSKTDKKSQTEAKPTSKSRVSTKTTAKQAKSKTEVKPATKPKTTAKAKTSKAVSDKTKTTTKAKTNTKGKKQVQKTQEELDLEREKYLNKKYGVGKWRILTRDEFIQRCTDLLLDKDDDY